MASSEVGEKKRFFELKEKVKTQAVMHNKFKIEVTNNSLDVLKGSASDHNQSRSMVKKRADYSD